VDQDGGKHVTENCACRRGRSALRELIGLAEQGEEVVIGYEDQPKVKLMPLRPAPQKRVFGQHRGKIWMRPDFDAPLPESFWLSGVP
jgi:antitoxin (DNA-binding transcriptional repressor) of toxin-antitoxin stability system